STRPRRSPGYPGTCSMTRCAPASSPTSRSAAGASSPASTWKPSSPSKPLNAQPGGREDPSEQVHELVTQRMIATLKRGTAPWRKPWQPHTGRPWSMSIGQPYRDVNVFLLALIAAEQTPPALFWGTYRPAFHAFIAPEYGEKT